MPKPDSPEGDCVEEHADLVEQYLDLTRHLLPQAASRGHWPIRDDHCFMRVLLDHLFGCCWYDFLDSRRAAYRQLSDDQLRRAIDMGHRMLSDGVPLVSEMNAQSLAWRRKYKF